MNMTRRSFFGQVGAFAGAGFVMPSLWAAMKYDKKGVLALFRLRAADTDARVRAGIEANRKGSFLFSFVGKDGKPLENVHVKLRQKAHDFRYGADLFMLDEMPSAELNAAYKARFAEAFNLATLPFYWIDQEPTEGNLRFEKNATKIYRRPPPDLCIEWCRQHGIEPKAHCLNYANTHAPWAKGDVAFEKEKLSKRFRELAARYADKIRMWEVTNETFFPDVAPKESFYNAEDFVEWSFKEAERHFPANELIINEAHCRIWNNEWFHWTRSPYYMQIERALLKGARIDTVGLQFHMFHEAKGVVGATRDFYDPQRLFDVMDTYAKFNRPLQITEITIPAYSNDPGDEEVQAEILRELYRIWFSARGMEAIIYWNLPDGYAAYAKPGDFSGGENAYYGGLCRFDMTPKPAFQVVKDLFGKEWRTNVDIETSGRYVFRGFYGTYDAEFTSNGKTVQKEMHLGKDFASDLKVEI